MPKQMDRDDEQQNRGTELAAGLAAAETMRNAAHHRDEEHAKSEEKVSIFWRVFGGTILSIVALAAVTLYNSLSSSISELRSELNKERECRADLVKKDEFNARITNQYERIRAAESLQNSLTALKGECEGLKEKVAGNATGLEAVRKDVVGLDLIRERVTTLEAVKKDLAGLEVMREKLTAVCGDLKTTREEFGKVQHEIGQNRAFDLERKAFRDSQMKQFDDSVKDVAKGLQECREKIARLEGQQPPLTLPSPSAPKAAARAATPAPVTPVGFQKPTPEKPTPPADDTP